MQQPKPETIALDDVVITQELSQRSPRSPNWQAEAQAMQSLARRMASDSETMLQSLVEMAVELCQAGTAGVSLLETTPDGEEVFRWNALAGTLAQYVGGSTPRNFSPCGVCLQRGTPVLFSHPERYFTYFQAAKTPVVEGLVLPLIADSHAFGTIWIISHDERRHFDSEDVRMMTSLADFAATALLLDRRQTRELLAANAALEAEIVERKQAEEKLRSARRRLELSLRGANLGVWTYNVATDEFWADDRAKLLYGHAAHEVRNFAEAGANIHPEDRDRARAAFAQAIQNCSKLQIEYRAIWRDGSVRWIASYAEFIPSGDRDEGMFYGVVQDISDRKFALSALHESEARSRALIENLPGGAAFVVDRDLRYLLAEGKALSVAGFKSEDLVGQTIFEVMPPELVANYEALYRKALAGESFEHEHNAHDRTYISRGTPLRSPNGEVYAVLAVSYDITERKQGEAALRESEARFRLFVTASSDIMYRMSADWREMRRLEGKNFIVNTENPSQTWIEIYIPQEEQLRVWAAIQNAIRTKSTFELEHRVIQQDGAIGWTFSRAIPMLDEQGNILEWFGTASDVTERKRAEVALRESEERFRTLANTAPALIWHNDAQGNNRFINQYFLDFTGKSAEQIRGEGWHNLIHPDDAEFYVADYLAAVRERRSWHNRNRIRRHDGVWRWHDNYAQPLFNADGVYLGHVGVTIDNTDTIAAEIALRESEAKYRSLFETVDEGFCIMELIKGERGEVVDIIYREANTAFEQQVGFGDAVGKRASEIFPRIEQHWLDALTRVHQTGVPERTEGYNADAERWFTLQYSRVGAGSPFVAAVFNDITNRKREEQRQAFLIKFADTIAPLGDPAVVAETACRMLVEHLNASRAQYTPIEGEPGAEIGTVCGEYVQRGQPMTRRFPLAPFGEAAVALLRGGEIFVLTDAERDPRFTDQQRETFLAADSPAAVTIPLVKEGRFVATFTVHDFAPRSWTADEIGSIEEVAERTWAAVERARAEVALRESELQRVREQSEREQERQRAESIAELDRAKTSFFSNVSHEFRTPLTLLLAPLQDALSDRVNLLPPSHREWLELAHRNANRLLKLVNTLLDFSRIEAGRMEAVYEPTDLAMFTTELASVFRSAIERAGLRLIVDCPPLPESVYVDREMWEKIVLNLLSNAFKFTLEGEIAVRLHRADGKRVMLQIQDTGTGIAPEEIPHLFERFYQIRGAKARTHEGSGIGLALVQELIKMHGGTVDVSSTVGQGTCFTVAIPLGTEHLPSDRLRLDVGDRTTTTRTLASTALGAAPYVEEVERWLPEAGSREQGAGSRETTPTHHSPFTTHHSARILLVDDNADMRDYLTRILGDRFQVEAVADGSAALAAARARVPDLVLSDVMMPHLDGFGLLQALRADPQTREIPIILLSARAGEEAVVSGLQAGADDYLIKPFSAAELVSRVNAHLQMGLLRSEVLHQERITSRRKDELLSTVSHELNTPLVAILGWTRLLRSSTPSQSMLMKSLETIERNAELQAKLIQDLLDISRIEAGKLRLSLEPVELKSVIEHAIAAVKTAAIAKDIHLQWKPTVRDPSVVILGDRDRLQQIICNLLTNAVKFTPEGGRVEISLAEVGNREQGAGEQLLTTNYQLPTTQQAQITISDTGIGISADFLPHVFDRFRQAEGSNSAKGLGLGLAIARHLVKLHNGTIHAASLGVGQGATFTVELPILSEAMHS